jgi:DNA sulfur modification protein DndE
MKPPVETVRVTERGRELLIKLKRVTGIQTWNILCRWALMASLADASTPSLIQDSPDSNVEIDWKTFAGAHADVFAALIRLQHTSESAEKAEIQISTFFKAHLHRGLRMLATHQSLTSFASGALEKAGAG